MPAHRQGPVKLVGGALEINLGFQLPFPSPKQHTSCDNTEVVTPDRECFQGYRSTIYEYGEALQTKSNRLSAESERPDRRVPLTPTHLALYIVSTRFLYRSVTGGNGCLQSLPQNTAPHNQVKLEDLVSRLGSLHFWCDSHCSIARLCTFETARRATTKSWISLRSYRTGQRYQLLR